jgi:hypothetical protein
MSKIISFNDLLEAADALSLDEQESLIDIIRRRIIERRREEIEKEVQIAQAEYAAGKTVVASPDEIMKEILS